MSVPSVRTYVRPSPKNIDFFFLCLQSIGNEKNIYDWLLPYAEKMMTNDNEMQKELIRFLIINNSESIGNESDIYEKFLINNLIYYKNQKLFI